MSELSAEAILQIERLTKEAARAQFVQRQAAKPG